MKLEELKNKKILIVGVGKEGKATLAFLQHYFPNQKIDIVDQKDGPDYLRNVENYDVVIKSPGIRPEVLTVPFTTAVNIFLANVKGTTIGITGTKGKSTTASLIHAILQQAGLRSHLVGNIGHPMLLELLQTNEKDDIWVCELSSYMTGDMQYTPYISIILNLFPEHMDYHGNIQNYYNAKKNLLTHASEHDFFIYNPEYEELSKLAKQTKAKTITFIDQLPFDKSTVPLPGEHNYDNVRAAITIAKILKISDKMIEQAVKNFETLPHRLENIGTYKSITFYDDAISTTPQSTIQAIKTLENIGTILLGGQDRGYDFSELADVIKTYNIPNIILFPDSGKQILSALQKTYENLPNVIQVDNTKEAILFAYTYTKPGEICLLSPASPSYSLWINFEERGDEFQREVREQG